MHAEHIHLPPALKKGDCIGLFSPSGPVREQEKFDAGVRILHDLGFQTRQYPLQKTDHEYLAAADKNRAKEFHAMWEDKEVKAMIAVRGGYGCLRMMPYLDLDILKESPKMVIGFSDLTVLLNCLADRAGIVAIHGPVLTSLSSVDKQSVDSLVSTLLGEGFVQKAFSNLKILREGTAEGILRGGNLTTIAHLLGTPWEIPLKDTLLFIEDTGEPMYKIDRMLTQLYVSNRLEQLGGLILGNFDLGTEKQVNTKLQEEVWERILELTFTTNFPIWANIPIGHREANHALPVGLKAIMDSSSGLLLIRDDNNKTSED